MIEQLYITWMVNSCNQIHLRTCLIVVIKHAYDVNKQMPQEESFATRLTAV